MIKIADIVLQKEKQGDRRIALQLVDLVANKNFEINILSGISKA